jgi:hypothetical protein
MQFHRVESKTGEPEDHEAQQVADDPKFTRVRAPFRWAAAIPEEYQKRGGEEDAECISRFSYLGKEWHPPNEADAYQPRNANHDYAGRRTRERASARSGRFLTLKLEEDDRPDSLSGGDSKEQEAVWREKIYARIDQAQCGQRQSCSREAAGQRWGTGAEIDRRQHHGRKDGPKEKVLPPLIRLPLEG